MVLRGLTRILNSFMDSLSGSEQLVIRQLFFNEQRLEDIYEIMNPNNLLLDSDIQQAIDSIIKLRDEYDKNKKLIRDWSYCMRVLDDYHKMSDDIVAIDRNKLRPQDIQDFTELLTNTIYITENIIGNPTLSDSEINPVLYPMFLNESSKFIALLGKAKVTPFFDGMHHLANQKGIVEERKACLLYLTKPNSTVSELKTG